MKKILIVLFPAIFCVFPVFAALRNVDVINGVVYEMWMFDDGSLSATVLPVDEQWLSMGVQQYTGDIIIPESVTYDGITYPVATIGYKAFAQCDDLISITIPPSVKEISSQAFWRSYNLIAVHISDLRAWCEINFSESNPLEYAHNLYLNNQKMTEVTVPEGITAIRPNAFHGGNFSALTMPETVTSIGSSAFNSCENLSNIVMSPNIETIGIFAFDYCKSLEEIEIPEKVEELERMTFFHCENLKKVKLPEGFRNIGVQAFSDCYSLEDINYPSTLTTIDISAFFGCTSLPDPIFPPALETIGNTAFYSIRNWHTLNLPASLEGLGAASFFCDNIEVFTIEAKDVPTRLGENPPFPFSDNGVIVAGFPTGSVPDYSNDSRFKYFMQDNMGNEKIRLDINLPDGIKLEFTKKKNIDEKWPWGIAKDQTSVFVPRDTQLAVRISSGDDKGYRMILNGEVITESIADDTFILPVLSCSSVLELTPKAALAHIDMDSNVQDLDIYTIDGRRLGVASSTDLTSGVYIFRRSDGTTKKVILSH